MRKLPFAEAVEQNWNVQATREGEPGRLPGRTWVALGGQNAYCLVMPFVDPDNPDHSLTVAEVRAMLDRGRAEAKAGQGTDLDLLLAKWDEEDAVELRAQQTGKSSAA